MQIEVGMVLNVKVTGITSFGALLSCLKESQDLFISQKLHPLLWRMLIST